MIRPTRRPSVAAGSLGRAVPRAVTDVGVALHGDKGDLTLQGALEGEVGLFDEVKDVVVPNVHLDDAPAAGEGWDLGHQPRDTAFGMAAGALCLAMIFQVLVLFLFRLISRRGAHRGKLKTAPYDHSLVDFARDMVYCASQTPAEHLFCLVGLGEIDMKDEPAERTLSKDQAGLC